MAIKSMLSCRGLHLVLLLVLRILGVRLEHVEAGLRLQVGRIQLDLVRQLVFRLHLCAGAAASRSAGVRECVWVGEMGDRAWRYACNRKTANISREVDAPLLNTVRTQQGGSARCPLALSAALLRGAGLGLRGHQIQILHHRCEALGLEAARSHAVQLLDGELHALVDLALVRDGSEAIEHAAQASENVGPHPMV